MYGIVQPGRYRRYQIKWVVKKENFRIYDTLNRRLVGGAFLTRSDAERYVRALEALARVRREER